MTFDTVFWFGLALLATGFLNGAWCMWRSGRYSEFLHPATLLLAGLGLLVDSTALLAIAGHPGTTTMVVAWTCWFLGIVLVLMGALDFGGTAHIVVSQTFVLDSTTDHITAQDLELAEVSKYGKYDPYHPSDF